MPLVQISMYFNLIEEDYLLLNKVLKKKVTITDNKYELALEKDQLFNLILTLQTSDNEDMKQWASDMLYTLEIVNSIRKELGVL